MHSFFAPEEYQRTNIRLHSELEPSGCLGDLGWYNIRFSLWVMNWRLPYAVTGRILSQRASSKSPAPTPTDFSGELIFNDDTTAGFFCSFMTTYQQWSIISGTKGSVTLPDFVHAVSIHEPSFEVNKSVVQVKCCECTGEHSESRIHAQDTRMIRNFVDQIHSGKLNDEWPMMAITTQRVMDACFESARNGSKLTLL